MTLAELLVKVGVDISDYESGMSRMERIGQEAGRALTSIGTTLTGALTLPLAGIGIGVTKMAADFETGLRKVGSLVGGLSGDQMKALTEQTLALSRALGVDAVKSTEALYEAISAGIPKDNALAFVEVASKTAIAGLTDSKVAVSALTTILAAYGLEASEAGKVSDAMFQAVNVGKFQFADLAAVIGPAAQQANNLGISYQELMAATATLSISSGSAGTAVTQVESAMRALLAPTKEMKQAFVDIGVSSGSAAVKAFGFEGTLQKLRESTKGSAEAFNALFGRIEGATGALGLTGDKAAKTAEDYEKLKHASDGLGATQVALNEINNTTARQFEKAAANVKATAIELGTSLLPAVNQLLVASKPLLASLQSAVQWFGKLSPTTQTWAIAVTTMVAALGPLVIIIGQTITAVSAISVALSGMSAATAALKVSLADFGAILSGAAGPMTLFQTRLLAIGAAAAAVAGAFILWEQFSRIKDNVSRLSEDVVGLAENLGLLVAKTGEASEAAKDHGVVLADGKTRMEEVGLASFALATAFDKAKDAAKKLSDVEWWEVILTVASPLGILNDAIERFGKSIAALRAVTKDSVQWQREAGDAAKTQADRLRDFALKTQGADISSQALNASLANSKSILGQVTTATEKSTKAWEEYQQKHQEMLGPLTLEQAIMAEQAKAMTSETNRWIASLAALPGKAEDFIQKLRVTARETFNLTTVLQTLNETAGLPNLRMAAIRMQEMAIAAGIAKKGIADYRKEFDEMVQGWSRVHPVWGIDIGLPPEAPKVAKETSQWMQQISTIMTDMSRNIAGGIFDLFKPSKKNQALDDEMAKLRESLAERGVEWEKHQAGVATQLAAITEKHAVELAKAEADLDRSLEKERGSYENFEADIERKRVAAREKNAASLAKEIDDLMAGQRKEEEQYEIFAKNVEAKLAELPAKYKDNLDRELESLQRSLADRVEQYDRFVEDANFRLVDIGADLGRNIEKQTAATNRRREAENLDYSRDTIDLNNEILAAEKKGDKKRVAELRETLRRRTEDHQISLRNMQEDLERSVADAKREAEEQTAKLKLELGRRAKDHAEFLKETSDREVAARAKSTAGLAADEKELRDSLAARAKDLIDYRTNVQAKIAAAVEVHRVELETEERDLDDSLIERRSLWEQYQRDAADQLAELRMSHAAELAEQEADLLAALEEKRMAWEQYRIDVTAQLSRLADEHETLAGRIRDTFVGALGEMGQAVARFGLESMTKGLFKWFGELLSDVFPSLAGALGKIFGGVFGGAGSAAGGAAGAAGGIGGGIGGAASGVLGTLGGIGSIASAITGVIGVFQQARQENTLNAIEENTRFGMIHSLFSLDALRTFLPPFKDFAEVNWFTFMTAFGSLMSTVEELRDVTRDRLVAAAEMSAQRLAEIQSLMAYPPLAISGNNNAVVNVYWTGAVDRAAAEMVAEIIVRDLRYSQKI